MRDLFSGVGIILRNLIMIKQIILGFYGLLKKSLVDNFIKEITDFNVEDALVAQLDRATAF